MSLAEAIPSVRGRITPSEGASPPREKRQLDIGIRDKIADSLAKTVYSMNRERTLSPWQIKAIQREKEWKAQAVERDLEQATRSLDTEERFAYSSAYRIFRGVAGEFDYSYFDESSEEGGQKLTRVLDSLNRSRKPLTPDTLWATVPEVDPHRKTRIQQGDLVEGVPFRPPAFSRRQLRAAALSLSFLTRL